MPSSGRLAGAERFARRPDRFTLFLAATAMIAAGLVLAREAAWGVALSWDSVQYVATARNLLDHPLEFMQTGGAHQDENAYRFWPPLYPVLLAAGSFGALDQLDVAGPLNAIAFGFTVFVAGTWLRRCVRSRFLLVWGCLALMLALPVAGIAAWAMSEPPFILFALLALLRAEAYRREGKRSALVQAAVLTALACLTRYMGVAVLAAVVPLLLARHGPSPAERLRAVAACAFLSLVPLALWIVRNALVLGEPTGNALPVDYSLPAVLFDLLKLLGTWAVHPGSGWWGRAAAALLALAIAAALLNVRRTRFADARWQALLLLGCFAVIFVILHLTAMFTGNTWHGIHERHISPIYIPLLIVVVVVLDHLLARPERANPSPPTGSPYFDQRTAIHFCLIASLSFWIIIGAKVNADDIRERNSESSENYASGFWENSEIMKHLAPHRDRGVYSNYPAALYVHRPGFREYGELKENLATGYNTNLTRFIEELATEGDSIVWFHAPIHPRFRYDADDLRALPGLDLVAEADDGVLFRIRGGD